MCHQLQLVIARDFHLCDVQWVRPCSQSSLPGFSPKCKIQYWIFISLSFSNSQDTEIRRRTVGENQHLSPHKEESMKSDNLEEDDENMMTTWKPFLVNICMFTFLTAGAYLFYRVCFHWWTCQHEWPCRKHQRFDRFVISFCERKLIEAWEPCLSGDRS